MNIVIAILAYMIYSNMLSILQAAIAQERMPAFAGMCLVHAGMLLVMVLMFYRRLSLFSLWRLLR